MEVRERVWRDKMEGIHIPVFLGLLLKPPLVDTDVITFQVVLYQS
jgi:hypothetical protein